jgi:hypothetical protein
VPAYYDAVPFAVALGFHSRRLAMGMNEMTLVSADQELNAAAAASSLLVEDPNVHP